MKKVILTIAAVAFTVVAANAQSVRVEVGIMSAGFKTFAQNNSTKKSDLEKKVNAKVQRKQAEQEKKAEQAKKAEQEKKAQQAKKAEQGKKAAAQKQSAKPAAKPGKKGAAKKTGDTNKSNAGQWFAAAWSAPYSGRPSAQYWIDLAK